MDAWWIIIALFIAGCLGGLTNAAIAGELRLPHTEPEARVYKPGWVGNVLVGGVAALVFWGLYGPMASAVLIGPHEAGVVVATLRVSELFAALLTGVGGGRLLTAEVDRLVLEKEKKALTETRDTLATAVQTLAQKVK
jgi:hypothetical protein